MTFTDKEIARVAHAAAVELATVLGDPALPGWSVAPSKDLAQEMTLVKAARFGASPEAVHEQRMQLDPDLPPFDQLPANDRAFAHLFAGVCTAMNKAADVKTRAENEQRALEESVERVAAFSAGNAALPFGAPPIEIQAPQAPQAPQEA